VVESGQLTGTVMNLLSDDTLLAFVIPVLYNVCVDYREYTHGLKSRGVVLTKDSTGPEAGLRSQFEQQAHRHPVQREVDEMRGFSEPHYPDSGIAC
jgi:hypothetical protein